MYVITCLFNFKCFSLYLFDQIVAIRGALFDTFRKRHKGVMELEEVQLTSSSLHRFVLVTSYPYQTNLYLSNGIHSSSSPLSIFQVLLPNKFTYILTFKASHKQPFPTGCCWLSANKQKELTFRRTHLIRNYLK